MAGGGDALGRGSPAPHSPRRAPAEKSWPVIETLLTQYDKNLDYARRLIADLGDSRMAACPDGVAMNHAAWVIGHLAFAHQVYARILGGAADAPAGWGSLFGGKSIPAPAAGQYPPKADLLRALERGHEVLTRLVRGKPASYWAQPPTDEKYRRRFATMGDALVHMLVNHEAVHLGQLSAWRRVQGLPPVS